MGSRSILVLVLASILGVTLTALYFDGPVFGESPQRSGGRGVQKRGGVGAGGVDAGAKVEDSAEETGRVVVEKSSEETAAVQTGASFAQNYLWFSEATSEAGELAELELVRLSEKFAPPAGFEREMVEAGSFAEFLRELPLRTDRRYVRSWAGVRLQSPSAAVVAMDVGARDLQQCADSIIRLHAEYLWGKREHGGLKYHFTSGDLSTWDAWKTGERFQVSGNRVKRVRSGVRDESRESFRRWLDLVFMYAGTRSLGRDSEPVAAEEVRAGDFFVTPGSPGHAVIVLDVARNSSGARVALIGQGFMPAQEFHILRGSAGATVDGVWFKLPETGGRLDTPSWRAFSAGQARRFLVE